MQSQCGRTLKKGMMQGGHNAVNNMSNLRPIYTRHQELSLGLSRSWFNQTAMSDQGTQFRYLIRVIKTGSRTAAYANFKSLLFFILKNSCFHPFPSLGRTHWVVPQYCHVQLYYYVIIWEVVVKRGCYLMFFQVCTNMFPWQKLWKAMYFLLCIIDRYHFTNWY